MTVPRLLALLASAGILACAGGKDAAPSRTTSTAPAPDGRLFTRLPSTYTGVAFANTVHDSREVNVFTYRNHYNGGGVAIGDLTGDGLPEVVLTSNEQGITLYLNEGKFRFREVTRAAGLVNNGSWTTGVTLADVDGDGRLDLYVCHAGKEAAKERANQLFLNRGMGPDRVPTFEEVAKAWGVQDGGYSTQAAFLDYDRDGDLDLYLVNNSPRAVSSFGLKNTRTVRDPLGGSKLYRNDGTRFTDVSGQAGIFGPEVAFGLGVSVGDVNRDGWPDIYQANDFFERDYLYLNNGNGTFTESLERQMPYTSYFSMGMDIADVDNDGWPDVYTTDMLPEDEYRLRTTSMFEGWNLYMAKVQEGYHYQFMRNMLQRNNGDGTFSDIGQAAGVARTDWSWSALMADLDLDGWKDIFVTNGLAKDVTSQDYVTSLANQAAADAVWKGEKVDFMKLVDAMSSTKIPDYAFHNAGGTHFTNEAKAWGLDTPSFSNGAAYGDLDGDGALDLVVNNVNDEAFVYRNNAHAVTPANHWLQVRLSGDGRNRYAIGARVTLWSGGMQQVQEVQPTRGFQSSMDYTLTFGTGAAATVDSVTVDWPDTRITTVTAVQANQRLALAQAEARAVKRAVPPATPTLLGEVATASVPGFRHRENDFVDFDRERLIPKMLSMEGPAMAVADVNGDGLDDVFIGGAKEQAGGLFLQQRDGSFKAGSATGFAPDSSSEDVGAVFLDADGNRTLDLYVVSGGNDFSEDSPALQDRLYLNDGRGNFRKAGPDALPVETIAGSRPAAADYDGDGDLDLFVGGRVVPWHYGTTPHSALLRNDGRGHFTDVATELAPDLATVGMVTDATWRDVDGDGRVDLVVVGDWLPITVFHNAGGGRLEKRVVKGLEASAGWWNRIVPGDFTGDGKVDFIVGNFGLNNVLHATEAEPLTLYVKDFDRNGFEETVMACYGQGKNYPFVMRDDLIKAIPPLKARYFNYTDYAKATIVDIFPGNELASATTRTAQVLSTVLARNNGDGSFTLVPLPAEAQLTPVFGILAGDFDRDGKGDLLLGGNFDGLQTQIGRQGASYGAFLRGDGAGGFAAVPSRESGFRVPGQVRDIQRIRTASGEAYVVVRNNDTPVVFRRRT